MSCYDDAAKLIVDLCDRAGIEYRDYSGRCMYGDRCFAIVADKPVDAILELVSEAFASLEPEDVETVVEGLHGSRTDSMGLSTVVYWPHLTIPEAVSEDEE